MNSEDKFNSVKTRLIEIYKRHRLPDPDSYIKTLEKINSILLDEDKEIRPRDSNELPGGIVYLKKYIPTIIVPDIHARMDFILNIILSTDSEGDILGGITADKLQVICVGDGVHGEKRAAKRWAYAFKEFEHDFEDRSSMDEEMMESLGTMEMIMEVKSAYPSNFHFLKGNHENISNEEGGGNYPFVKFSYEGPMTAYYIRKFFGSEFLDQYYSFEKNLPVFAVGKNFLVSHAEPYEFFDKGKIVNYRNNPDVIEGLTWTADDAAVDGSVRQMIDYYIADEQDRRNSYYFGGHRPINGNYNQRADGRYVQIHNPNKFIIARIGLGSIDLDKDIVEVENNTEQILGEYYES